MAIVSLREMLEDARRGGYAVPLFDTQNMAMIRSAVQVAEEENSPVIIAGVEFDYEGDRLDYWMALANRAAIGAKVPVCIMLDHAASLELCVRCADAGFTGVMIDASALPFEENAELTRRVCEQMRRRGVGVEAELGHVGVASAGGEGELGDHAGAGMVYTEPGRVAECVGRSGCDALAVSIGTAHGVYATAPELQIGLLDEINRVSPVPLVLHGGSGTPEDQIRAAIRHGIAKINICSEIMDAWHRTVVAELGKSPNYSVHNSAVCRPADEAVREVMRNKIRLFGSGRRG